MLQIYTLANCDSCRAATKWLRAKGIAFGERAIRETPPAAAQLRVALPAYGNDVRKLFNTAGRDYRAQQLSEKLSSMSLSAALALLGGNGNLVKRPFAVGDDVALVGFDATTWSAALSGK